MSLCLSCVNWKVRIWKIALLWTPKQTYQCVPTVRWIHYYIYFFKTVIASGLYFSGNVCSFLKELTLWFYEGFGIWNAVKENAKCHLSWIHSLPYCSSDKQRSHNSSQMIKGDPLCRKSLRWRIKSLLGSVSYTAGLWVKKDSRRFSAEGDLWSRFRENYCSVWRDKVSRYLVVGLCCSRFYSCI